MTMPTYTTPYEIQFTEGERVARVGWDTPHHGIVEGLPGTVVCAPRYSRVIVVHFDGDMHFTKVQGPQVRHVGPWRGFDGAIYHTGDREVTMFAGPIEIIHYED